MVIEDGMKEQATIPPKVYGFIITKPLQLMVVIAIIDQLPIEIEKELLVVNGFFDAQKIAERLNIKQDKWRSVTFFCSTSRALRHCRRQGYDSVLIDSDVGFRKNTDLIKLKLFSPKTILAVYEEGVGTYRSDLYGGLKKKIMSIFGIGTYFGGNWLTEKVYLFAPNEYRTIFGKTSSELIGLKYTISELVIKYETAFEDLFGTNELKSKLVLLREIRSENCVIYLSNWSIDADIVNSCKKSRSCSIIKPHPHIKKIPLALSTQFDLVVSPSVPAEILITMASRVFKEVYVSHHGSSVVRYINMANVYFKYVDKSQEDYAS